MYRLKQSITLGIVSVAICLFGIRGYSAIASFMQDDQTSFLAFPLTVIMPGLAFVFLALRRDMASQEGVLMQLGAMIHILLMIALPGLALHIALGFPIVFLLVELFETRAPASMKSIVKARLIS